MKKNNCCVNYILVTIQNQTVILQREIQSSLKNLKTNIDNLHVGKLKTVPEGLKKIINVVSN